MRNFINKWMWPTIGVIVGIILVVLNPFKGDRNNEAEMPNVAGLDTLPTVVAKNFLADKCLLSDGQKLCSTNPSAMRIEGDSALVPVGDGKAKICADRPLESLHFNFEGREDYLVGKSPDGQGCIDFGVMKR